MDVQPRFRIGPFQVSGRGGLTLLILAVVVLCCCGPALVGVLTR